MPISWISPPALQATHPLAKPATHCLAYDQHGVICYRSRNHSGYHANAEVGHVWEDMPPSPTGEDWGKTETRVTDPESGGMKGQKLARFDMIPPDVLWELAEHYGKGEAKYPSDETGLPNWQRGYSWRLSSAALQRHLFSWLMGEDTDPETGSSHLTAAIWHAIALRWFQLHGKGKDYR